MFSRGYFPSEECQGRRVALQCYKQHGVGVRLWTGVKVAKDTRLLSFKVDQRTTQSTGHWSFGPFDLVRLRPR